ncbi:multidrug effflux MFS transporter [Pelagibius litoralis]|uniref:Bcr/CflA family efflux transporter n=1 Tax=Pelagibius litoralis TaxID=374515 RepID=A0A967K992_9PROT|nr:multidrug effflux MFS transporter [Pelagibius litoralis]NIA69194.1 multidrug effflux MFS transporter [Pelagibius litoralis]
MSETVRDGNGPQQLGGQGVAPRASGGVARRRPPLAVLIAVTALGPMALNIFIPSMPGLQAVFATDYGTIQLTLTLYLFGVAVSQLFLGPLSDRFGRRPVLLLGMLLFLFGTLLCAFAGSIAALIVGRVIQAVGGCAGLVLGRAIVRDTHSREESASMIGYITMAMVIAPMVAPLLGGITDDLFGWQASFFLVFAVGAAVLLLAWHLLFETHFDRQAIAGPLSMISGFGSLLKDAAFTGYAINISFTTAVFFAFLAGAPFIMLEVMDRTATEYGLYFMLNAISYMLGNFLSGRLSTQIGAERMIFAGSAIALLGVALLTGLALSGEMTPIMLFGPVMLVGLANGLSLPNATASAISVRPDLAGTASGLTGFLQMTVGGLATLLVGHFQGESSIMPMVMVMSGAAVIAFLGHFLARAALALRAGTSLSPGAD